MENKDMNYEKMFKWVADQVRNELSWTREDLEENETDKRLNGMKFAYESILGLIENLEEKGYEGYKEECEKTTKRLNYILYEKIYDEKEET